MDTPTESSEHFLLALQGANDGFWDWDLTSGEIYFSPRWKELLGYAETEISPCAEEWTSRVFPEDREALQKALQRLLSGQTSCEQLEYRLRHKDGSYRWILSRSASLRNGAGKPIRLGGWHIDITEHKWAQEQLEQRLEQRTRELSLLLQVTHAVASTLELPGVLNTILEQLKTVVDYRGAAIYLIEGQHLVLLGCRGSLSLAQMQRLVADFERSPAYRQIVQQRQVVFRSDLQQSAEFVEAMQRGLAERAEEVCQQFCSWMGVPLIVNDRVIGVVTLHHSRPHAYTQQHALLAFALANQAAVALETAQLYQQAQALAVLKERHRLARELHDSVIQQLYGLSLSVHSAIEALPAEPEEALDLLELVRQYAEAAQAELRALIFELRPETLETEGLIGALEKHAELLRLAYQLPINTVLEQEPQLRLEQKEALYRIAQEALHNVVQHARARMVTLRLVQEGQEVVLEVRDDGRGFDPTTQFLGHLGLQSMRERAANLGGTFRLSSAPGQGTTLIVRIPHPGGPVSSA